MPEPVRLVVCGLLPALSLTVSVPLNVPVLAGANATEIVQLAPLASFDGVIGQVVAVSVKLADTVMLVIARAVVKPLVSVAVCGALVVPST